MALRKCLLGLAGAIAVSGVTTAEPPNSPLVEGRELDPVTRDFHLPEARVGGYVASPAVAEQENSNVWVAIATGVMELLIDGITFPLGTALMSNERPTIHQ